MSWRAPCQRAVHASGGDRASLVLYEIEPSSVHLDPAGTTTPMLTGTECYAQPATSALAGLVADATSISSTTASIRTLRRARKAGGAAESVVVQHGMDADITLLAVDSRAIYWTTTHEVWRLAK